jgi:predicted transcriptional regulator
MTDILALIENSKKTKKESIASTIRMPEQLYTFIEELAAELDLSKQEVMLKLLQQGAAAAEEALKKVEEGEPKVAAGFHVLNTNKAHSDEDHEWMLAHQAAAAFYSPWKLNINRIKKGEVVFLYENGKGIVAYGRGTGDVQVSDHMGNKDERHYQVLERFKILEKPLSAAAIKKELGRNVVFLRTMSGMPDGQKVLDLIESE